MSLLRILTVDDELLALRRLKLLLDQIPQARQVGEASSCSEALSKINDLKPDLVLLDIKMRDGNGFELVDAIARMARPPAVVFVTAFDQFAAQAFDTPVADYLLKPVDRDRLSKALSRVEQQLHARETEQRVEELQQILNNLRANRGEGLPAFETEFWIRGSTGMVRVPVDSIEYVGVADEYVALHTPSGVHLMRGSLRRFAGRVEPGLFIRVHRRWLVRRSAIAELSMVRAGQKEVILHDGRRLPTGRIYLKQLRAAMTAGSQIAPRRGNHRPFANALPAIM